MSKVVILKIDTLSHVFTTLESGSKCQFQYELINNDKISNVIQPLVVNDAVLCVFDDVVKIALRVVSKTFDKVTLTKEIELNEGFQITDKNILRVLNDTQIYECNVDFKKNLYESLTGNFKSTLRQLFEIDITEEKEINSGNTHTKQQSAMNFTPSQIIYYGVPGCGKSHAVDAEINKAINGYNEGKTDGDKISYEDQVKRIVFHPDYGNADFIGQIMPKIRERGGVDYVFKPGPFSQILRKAYLNSSKPYFLVIEEINRGNAAAIFGEIFQLLDRIKSNKKDKSGYGPGWSSYSILNDDVNDYIRDIKAYEKSDHSGCMKANHPKDMLDGNGNPVDSPDANGKKEIDFSTATSFCSLELILQGFDSPQIFRESTDIRLPPNLSIYATMNTSDQNVFTLDNAFQRRWEMKQIPNDLKNTGDSAAQYRRTIKKVKKTESGEETIDTNVQWGDFRKAINEVIMDSAQANGLSSMEDKRLGGWFYTESDNFAEKVLKYLWDDAFKFDRPNQFNDVTTLEELVEKFNGDDGFNVFKDGRISELQKDSLTTPDTPAQNDTSVTNG
ncbi:MAG: hypothetical protein SPL21_14255 [Fibrobacter sp.]|nr:hypothetical protein [Fibrobacter sp.]